MDPIFGNPLLKKQLSKIVDTEKNFGRGVILVLKTLLEQAESPLVVESTQFEDQLRQLGYQGKFELVSETRIPGWVFVVGLILLCFVVVLFILRLLSLEIRMDHLGLMRVRPFAFSHLRFRFLYRKFKKNGQGIVSGSGVYGSW
jgi:hypothetical protein